MVAQECCISDATCPTNVSFFTHCTLQIVIDLFAANMDVLMGLSMQMDAWRVTSFKQSSHTLTWRGVSPLPSRESKGLPAAMSAFRAATLSCAMLSVSAVLADWE